MRRIREMLRLRLEQGLSQREVARSVGVSPSTVWDLLTRMKAARLTWPLDAGLDDAALEARLYPPEPPAPGALAMPDLAYVHHELRRKGVTLQLLWQEYKATHLDNGYQYSRFCGLYEAYEKKLDVVMRQVHRAGEKAFVDWSGDGVAITDPATGNEQQAELFVAVLGASNYTYAEAAPSQELRQWIQVHVHAYEYFQGVPALTIPDNTKTAVEKPCRYDPTMQATYQEMAAHYGTAILPARARKPRDKAKVEVGVLIAQRWILAALRNHRFFSVAEANEAIWRKLDEMNDKPFEKVAGTRRVLFETIDRPALKPLPSTRYEFGEWSRPKVNVDYHIDVDKHFYSVPFQLIHEHVDARRTATTVEVFFKGRRVCTHERSYGPGFTTVKEHMPKGHQQHLEWTPTRILSWAADTGPNTARLAEKIMAVRAHPEQGYRACLGILRLGKGYGRERLEAACARALVLGAYGYRNVESILKSGADRLPLPGQAGESEAASAPIEHGNIRGPGYYH
ncbi:MAG: IS21 family transposase [Deltaproteobacteria bacterium]|nr:IS21 family transposase [Deltaproteobacteria bacterium]